MSKSVGKKTISVKYIDYNSVALAVRGLQISEFRMSQNKKTSPFLLETEHDFSNSSKQAI